MNRIYPLQEDEAGGGVYRRILLLMGKSWGTWLATGAAVGLSGGLLSIVIGTLVWAVLSFEPDSGLGSTLNVFGTVLFVLPLPLLALGAHCLDLLEKKPPVIPLSTESRT